LRMLRLPASGLCLFLSVAFSGAGALAQQPDPQTSSPVAAPPASQELIYQGEATSILGRQVSGPDGKNVGRIVDVLVSDMGQPLAVVVDVGGFLGIGNRRIAVVWRALHFTPEATGEGRITLEMTTNQIKATPEYKAAGTPVVVAAPPRTEQTPP
jgi:PRC-barrel domain